MIPTAYEYNPIIAKPYTGHRILIGVDATHAKAPVVAFTLYGADDLSAGPLEMQVGFKNPRLLRKTALAMLQAAEDLDASIANPPDPTETSTS